jgi:hypothetical protein
MDALRVCAARRCAVWPSASVCRGGGTRNARQFRASSAPAFLPSSCLPACLPFSAAPAPESTLRPSSCVNCRSVLSVTARFFCQPSSDRHFVLWRPSLWRVVCCRRSLPRLRPPSEEWCAGLWRLRAVLDLLMLDTIVRRSRCHCAAGAIDSQGSAPSWRPTTPPYGRSMRSRECECTATAAAERGRCAGTSLHR